jgi:hypothetical protein
MAKKILLDTRSEPARYSLFGISCHLKDYRLSFLLNQKLELALIKMDDFTMIAGQGKVPDIFSFYFCRDEDHYNAYYLVSNRGQEGVLLPDLKQTDYLLLVEGPFKKNQSDKLLDVIRSIPNVLTAFGIRFETIRNYESFLTDLELHFMNIVKESKVKYSPSKK